MPKGLRLAGLGLRFEGREMKRRTFIKALGGMAGLVLAPAISAMPVPRSPYVKIAFVGLGGAGGRIVSKLASDGPARWGDSDAHVELYAIDTDRRSLDYTSDRVRRILLPGFPSGSMGSCIYPQYARQAAWHHRDKFSGIWNRQGLPHEPIIIVVAGFGRGAGTGLAQALSWQARQYTNFTWPMLSMPLSREVHAISIPEEMRRMERATDNSLALFYPDESNVNETVAATIEKVDQQIINDLQGMFSTY